MASIDSKIVYKALPRNHHLNTKLIEEFKEKGVNYQIFDQIYDTMSRTLNKTPSGIVSDNSGPAHDGWCIKVTTEERKFDFTVPMSNQRLEYFKTKDPATVTLMVIRYSTIVNTGQQWALPQAQFKYLHDHYGISHEGFASPLNSGLMLEGGKFCSLFKSIDTPFGSIGSFFDQKLAGSKWVVNPPFIDAILQQATEKILAELENATDTIIVYVIPTWSDSVAYTGILRSRFLKHTELLKGNDHFYEHQGKRIVTAAKSTVFVLDTYTDNKNYAGIANQMRVQ
jgi:hypothetical protein